MSRKEKCKAGDCKRFEFKLGYCTEHFMSYGAAEQVENNRMARDSSTPAKSASASALRSSGGAASPAASGSSRNLLASVAPVSELPGSRDMQGRLQKLTLQPKGDRVAKPVSAPASAKDHKDAVAHGTKGSEFNKKGDYQSAIHALTQAIVLDPNFANAYQGRAYAHAMTNSLDLAIKDYSTTIQLDPNNWQHYMNRAMSFWQFGELDRALDDFQEVVTMDPKNVTAYVKLGEGGNLKGDYAFAIDCYGHAIKSDLKCAEAYLGRGLAYSQSRDFDAAMKDLSEAIRLQPTFGEAYYNRGWIRKEKGDRDLAIGDFNEAIKYTAPGPPKARAYRSRAFAHVQAKNYKKAVEDFASSLQYEKNLRALEEKAFCHYSLGEYQQAIDDNTELISKDPRSIKGYYNRGLAYVMVQNYRGAISDFTTVIDLDPRNSQAYCNRAVCYAQLGDYERAIADFTRCLEIDPTNNAAREARGLCYYHLGDSKMAMSDWIQVSNSPDDSCELHTNLGNLYLKNGDLEKAIEEFTKAIAAVKDGDPRAAPAFSNRAYAYALLGKFDEAIRDATKALQLDPTRADAYHTRGKAYEGKEQWQKALDDHIKATELAPKNEQYWRDRRALEGAGVLPTSSGKSMKDMKVDVSKLAAKPFDLNKELSDEEIRDLLDLPAYVKITPELRAQVKAFQERMKKFPVLMRWKRPMMGALTQDLAMPYADKQAFVKAVK